MANKDRGATKVKKVASKSLKEKRAIKKAKSGKTTSAGSTG